MLTLLLSLPESTPPPPPQEFEAYNRETQDRLNATVAELRQAMDAEAEKYAAQLRSQAQAQVEAERARHAAASTRHETLSAELEATLKSLRDDLEAAETRNAGLMREVETAQAGLRAAQSGAARAAADQFAVERQRLQATISEVSTTNVELQAKLDALSGEVAAQETSLRSRVEAEVLARVTASNKTFEDRFLKEQVGRTVVVFICSHFFSNGVGVGGKDM